MNEPLVGGIDPTESGTDGAGHQPQEHVVFSTTGGPQGPVEEFRRAASLEEAVRVVEHLRNDLGITETSVYALTPVPLTVKAYYRVEPAVEPLTPAAASGHSEMPAEAAVVPQLLPPAPALTAVPLTRTDRDGERSLGYFAR